MRGLSTGRSLTALRVFEPEAASRLRSPPGESDHGLDWPRRSAGGRTGGCRLPLHQKPVARTSPCGVTLCPNAVPWTSGRGTRLPRRWGSTAPWKRLVPHAPARSRWGIPTYVVLSTPSVSPQQPGFGADGAKSCMTPVSPVNTRARRLRRARPAPRCGLPRSRPGRPTRGRSTPTCATSHKPGHARPPLQGIPPRPPPSHTRSQPPAPSPGRRAAQRVQVSPM